MAYNCVSHRPCPCDDDLLWLITHTRNGFHIDERKKYTEKVLFFLPSLYIYIYPPRPTIGIDNERCGTKPTADVAAFINWIRFI